MNTIATSINIITNVLSSNKDCHAQLHLYMYTFHVPKTIMIIKLKVQTHNFRREGFIIASLQL